MEPQVRYVTSKDGTRIAVSSLGQGQPLVWMGTIGLATMESGWQLPSRDAMKHLALKRKVIRFDNRGQGLSDRHVDDFSLEARLNDLAAVVQAIAESPIELIASGESSMVAIAYAAANPGLVRGMALVWPAARGSDYREGRPARRVLEGLIEVDWEAYVQTTMMLAFGWTDLGRTVAQTIMNATSPQVYLAARRALRDYDVNRMLAEVKCPTLVVRSPSDQSTGVSAEAVKHVAVGIPNARLHIYEGLQGRIVDEPLADVIETFLDDCVTATSQAPSPSGTAVILFADIADSTALTERLGGAAFRAKARELDAALRAAIRERDGTAIEGKLLGDGVLAVFTSARQAIEAALACREAGDDAGLPLHLGLHAGDVIREDNNVYGGAVNVASRISGLSAAGEVLVSDTVRSLARTSAGVRFEDRGEQSLKGVGEAVRVWAVVEGE